MAIHQTTELTDAAERLYRNRYHEEIGHLANHYPQERRSLEVDYDDVFRTDPELADDLLNQPEMVVEAFGEALRLYDKPIDVELGSAHVRVHNLPDGYTYFPGEFSPSEHEGTLRAVRGEIAKATDVYSRLSHAAFECQRCGTLTEIPQVTGSFQEPHECQGCERQGPFEINYDKSEFVDGQKLRIQTPPEFAQGDGQDIDAFVEDDLTDLVTAGDRVTVTGVVELEQQTQGNNKTAKFEPYLDGHHISVEQTDAEDLDITPEKRKEIEALAAGEKGDPLELAAASYAPKIYGYETEKKALVLALVGGSRTEYSTGDFDRGEFHVLLIGDPSTGKSKLVDRAETVGWRAVGVSGKGATVAGVTATATQDDFGDGSWTLDAGAAVKANRGVLAIDELDDMPAEVRAALLEPMSKQTIHVTKGGINTHLQTRTAVVAAANPEKGRFDQFEPIAEQFVFTGTLLSRFDLVFTFTDEPDEEQDDEVAEHILSARDSAKRHSRGMDIPDDAVDPEPPIDQDTLRAWIALAKRQPEPVFASDEVKETLKSRWESLRGLYDYDESEPVPVTLRDLEGTVRVAEAAAKFEFSETIEQRHADIAAALVGRSMQDIGRDEDGNLDADVKETGSSKAQKDRVETIVSIIKEVDSEYEDENGGPIDVVIDRAEEGGIDPGDTQHEIDQMKKRGEALEPGTGYIRYIGRR